MSFFIVINIDNNIYICYNLTKKICKTISEGVMKTNRTKKFLLMLVIAVSVFCLASILLACDNTDANQCEHKNVDVTDTATCVADGTKTFVCKDCGKQWTEDSTATGHSYGSPVVVTEATCLEPGKAESVCTVCGEKKTEIIDSEGHTYTAESVAPTCMEAGYTVYTCQACGFSYEGDEVPALGHSMKQEVVKEATCLIGGEIRHSCERCEYSYVEKVAAAGHKYEVIDVVEPTCIDGGYTVEKCSACKDEIHTNLTEAVGHQLREEDNACVGGNCRYCDNPIAGTGHDYVFETDTATCTDDGLKTYKCKKCEDILTVDSPAKGHIFGEWGPETREADFECHYVKTRVCESCSKEEKEDSYRHVYSSEITVAATCQENSGEKTFICIYCNDSYKENYTDKNNHIWDEGVVQDGYTLYTCACGFTKKVMATFEESMGISSDDVQNTDELSTANASFSFDETAKNSIAGNGNMTISAGTLTEEEKGDLNLSQEITDKIGNKPIYDFTLKDESDNFISDFNSGFVTVKVPYTLEEGEDPESIAVWYINDNGEVEQKEAVYSNGYAIFTTDHFSYYTVVRLTPAERCALYGHSFVENVVNPTCLAGGYTERKCLRCGEYEKTDETDKLAHDYKETIQEPTCTESGWRTTVCQMCKSVEKNMIPATGHSYKVTAQEEATCTKAGSATYTCENCSDSYIQTLPKKNHSYINTVVEPTCVTQGYTSHVCNDCGFEYRDKFTAVWGHDLQQKIVAPTCTAQGYTVYSCSRCDYEYTADFTEATGHRWDISRPTCGKGQVCTVCGTAGQPATGKHIMDKGKCKICGAGCTHSYTESVIAPTCLTAGYTKKQCSICSKIENTDYIPALGHNYEVVENKPATCTESGYVFSICSRCSDEKYEFYKAKGHTFSDGYCTSCGAADPALPRTYINMLKSFFSSQYSGNLENLKIVIEENGGFDTCIVEPTVIRFNVNTETRTINAYGEIRFTYDEVLRKYSQTIRFSVVDNIVYYETQSSNIYGDLAEKDGSFYGRLTTDEMLKGMFGTNSISTDDIFDILSVVQDKIVPALEKMERENYDLFNMWAKKFYETAFVKEETDNGPVWALDVSVLSEFVDNLVSMPMAKLIDRYFGNGSFDSIEQFAEKLLDMTVVGAFDYIEEATSAYGLTATEICDIVNFAVNKMFGLSGEDAFDFERDILLKEEYQNSSVRQAISDASGITVEEFDEIFGSYITAAKEQVIFAEGPVKFISDIIVSMFEDGTSMKINTLADGTVKNVVVEANDSNCNGNMSFTGKMSLYPEEISEINDKGFSGTVKELFEFNFRKVEGESEEIEFIVEDGRLHVKIPVTNKYFNFNINGVWSEYLAIGVIDTYIDTDDVDEAALDCGTVYGINCNVPMEGKDLILYRIDNGEMIPVELPLEGLTTRVSFYYDRATGTVYYDSQHNYVYDEELSTPAIDCATPSNDVYVCDKCGFVNIEHSEYVDHNYDVSWNFIGGIEDCDAGVEIIYVCKDCGYINKFYTEGHHWIEEIVDLSEFGITEDILYKRYCPCGKENRYDIKESEYIFEQKGFSIYDDKNGINYDFRKFSYEKDGVVVKLLNVNEVSYLPDECKSVNTNKIFIDVDDSVISEDNIDWYYQTEWYAKFYSSCTEEGMHTMKEYAELINPQLGCEGGVKVFRICEVCGYEESDKIVYDHVQLSFETDLSQYGCGCGGKIVTNKCMCGYENNGSYLDINCSFEQESEYLSDNRVITYYTCVNCSFKYELEAISSKNGCEIMQEETYYVYDNGNRIEILRNERKFEEHVYELVSSSLRGESCEDGVNVVKRCIYCGEQEEKEIFWHERYYGKVDLRDYGCVCDSYIIIDACACGKEFSYHTEGECDFELNSQAFDFDEDGKTDREEYTYTCAVTDPLCGFTFKAVKDYTREGCSEYESIIFIKDDGTVIAGPYVGNLSKNHITTTETTTDEYVNEAGNTVEVVTNKITCACGYIESTEIVTTEKDPYGNVLSMRKDVFSKSGTETLKENYQKFIVDGKMSDWEILSRYIQNDEIGMVMLEKFEYDTSKCMRRQAQQIAVSESELEKVPLEWQHWEEYHILNEQKEQTSHATCTQPGIIANKCLFCEKTENIYYDYEGYHNYVKDEENGWWVCDVCGLINFTGADGDIVLEDMSTETEYVVGYANNSIYSFIFNVTLIPKVGGEEVLIADIAIENMPTYANSGYVKVSKTDVEAKIAQLGLVAEDYDVRISFVPEGEGGNLDYGITFAEGGPSVSEQ